MRGGIAMFTYVSPAEAGVSAKQIQKYIQVLEKHGIETHDMILARGNQIFFEQYWSPLHAGFAHRMYSTTKSYVSIAEGFAIQDGLVALDDRIVDYFPEDVPENVLKKDNLVVMLLENGIFVKHIASKNTKIFLKYTMLYIQPILHGIDKIGKFYRSIPLIWKFIILSLIIMGPIKLK